jgi:hypothetical protein
LSIRDRIVELRRVRASDLIPNHENWRTHPKAQKDALQGILDEIGYADALLAREVDGKLILIDGHLRRETTPDSMVPVLVLDVSESEAQKMLMTLDPLAAMAGTDKDQLKVLFENVETESQAVADMLTNMAIDAGIIPRDEPAEEGPDPCLEKIAELISKWETKDGQRWKIRSRDGEVTHYLRCGDSTSPEAVSDLLRGAEPFLMVTDPPYGVDYDASWRNDALGGNRSNVRKVENDDRVDWTAAYQLFQGAVVYVWHGGKYAGAVASHLEASAFQIRAQIVWRKPQLVVSRGHYHGQHEPCWYAVRKGQTSKWTGDRKQSTMWDISNQRDSEDSTVHSTQKPVECMARPMRNHGEKGCLVYDPFLGSGTSIIAAEQSGRVCYGMELDPGYVAVILQRCSDFGMIPELDKASE